MTTTLLLVEDESSLRESLEAHFAGRGWRVIACPSCTAAREAHGSERIDLVLLDLRLPDGTGVGLLQEWEVSADHVPVVVMTAYPEVRTAVEAMKLGAHDYVNKPFELEELDIVAERALDARRLRKDIQRFRHGADSALAEVVVESPAMRRVMTLASQVAASPSTHVLLLGETGSGKEVVANAVHRLSARASSPLVKVNCSTLPESLMESELFGHEKGAFTDARQARTGLFELADGGTLFLDEVSEMKPEVQPKLLRVIEGQPFRRIGGTKDLYVDVRIIAATNRNLESEIRRGRFREDLYYRLKVFAIELPRLRERCEDIVPLAVRFVRQFSREIRGMSAELSEEARDALVRYRWPGNVRELRNMMERAAILASDGVVFPHHLSIEAQAEAALSVYRSSGPRRDSVTLDDVQRLHTLSTLQDCKGNKSEAARKLGISRKTLREKLGGWGIADEDRDANVAP